MWQILPIILLPVFTIAIAYILEFFTYWFSQIWVWFSLIPNWTPTVLMLILVVLTYRSLKASSNQDI